MTHDGAGMEKHLAALQEHGEAHRAEVHDAARAAAVELEAERTAIEDGEPGGHDEPATAA